MIDDELRAATAEELRAYLQGALKDGTWSARHGTHRFAQANRRWLEILQQILSTLECSGWIYREGRDRDVWILETSARFLSLTFDATTLKATSDGLAYVRGYFDAEGGMPHDVSARLYFQFVQKDRRSLEVVSEILRAEGIHCGRLHNPSRAVDPEFWRFYVLARSHGMFMSAISSWHPLKRQRIEARRNQPRLSSGSALVPRDVRKEDVR